MLSTEFKESKDHKVGRQAYITYFGPTPQVPFEDLSHKAIMRWVWVARAVINLHESYRRGAPGKKPHAITNGVGMENELTEPMADGPSNGKAASNGKSKAKDRNRGTKAGFASTPLARKIKAGRPFSAMPVDDKRLYHREAYYYTQKQLGKKPSGRRLKSLQVAGTA